MLTTFEGNLSSEKVTKRDIFHVFHIYGELAQISIKQAYGFVQFLRAEDCQYALESEQGTQIRDKRIRTLSMASHTRVENQLLMFIQILKSASRRRTVRRIINADLALLQIEIVADKATMWIDTHPDLAAVPAITETLTGLDTAHHRLEDIATGTTIDIVRDLARRPMDAEVIGTVVQAHVAM